LAYRGSNPCSLVVSYQNDIVHSEEADEEHHKAAQQQDQPA